MRQRGLIGLVIVCLGTGLLAGTRAHGATGWQLVWSDEFTQPDGSSPDSSRWAFDIGTGSGGWGNNELQYYTSRTNNARIEGGNLVIEAKQESYSGKNYTSARLKTQGKAAWTYGRMEARMKIPRGQGIWPAFWMLGTNITTVPWPGCGEIDIMENIGAEPAVVHGTIHGPGYSGGSSIGGSYTLGGGAAFADDFHVFAVEWETNRLRWFMDGQPYFTATPSILPGGATWVFTQPQFIILNLAVGGNWPGSPNASTVFPQRLVVDYVRVYAATNSGVAEPAPCGGNAVLNPGFEAGGLANWVTYGTGGNTQLAGSNSLPVRSGGYSFKVYGQFSGSENYSGIYQDAEVSPGTDFTAGGWALTPSNDRIAGANTAWLEAAFRDASGNNLRLYRSAAFNSSTPAGTWQFLAITNQLNPATYQTIGSVTSLVAPAGTARARFQVVFRQPQTAGGAVLFDDLSFAAPLQPDQAVPSAALRSGNQLNIAFPTFGGLKYQVRFKDDLGAAGWQPFTNVAGDGGVCVVPASLVPERRFFQVMRVCN